MKQVKDMDQLSSRQSAFKNLADFIHQILAVWHYPRYEFGLAHAIPDFFTQNCYGFIHIILGQLMWTVGLESVLNDIFQLYQTLFKKKQDLYLKYMCIILVF